MNKEELISLLKDYKENKARLNIKLKELKMKRIQLKSYDDIDISLSTAYGINQDIHSKNQISDKVLRKVEQNDMKRRQLQEEINELEKIVIDLREKVESVNDRLEALKYKEREILTAYYVEGRTAEDIGNKLYFQLFSQTRSDRHIQRIIEKATEKMINL